MFNKKKKRTDITARIGDQVFLTFGWEEERVLQQTFWKFTEAIFFTEKILISMS